MIDSIEELFLKFVDTAQFHSDEIKKLGLIVVCFVVYFNFQENIKTWLAIKKDKNISTFLKQLERKAETYTDKTAFYNKLAIPVLIELNNFVKNHIFSKKKPLNSNPVLEADVAELSSKIILYGSRDVIKTYDDYLIYLSKCAERLETYDINKSKILKMYLLNSMRNDIRMDNDDISDLVDSM
jgi:hypothetical protein